MSYSGNSLTKTNSKLFKQTPLSHLTNILDDFGKSQSQNQNCLPATSTTRQNNKFEVPEHICSTIDSFPPKLQSIFYQYLKCYGFEIAFRTCISSIINDNGQNQTPIQQKIINSNQQQTAFQINQAANNTSTGALYPALIQNQIQLQHSQKQVQQHH